MGMKQILVMMAVVVLVVGCRTTDVERSGSNTTLTLKKLTFVPIVEKAVRKSLKKPKGKLIEGDLAKVTELYLAGTKITDEDLKSLSKVKNLELLALQGTQISNAGLKEVAKLRKLRSLGLNGTKITDGALKEVVKLRHLNNIGLSGTQITDEGLEELAKLRNLTGLYLYETQVTKAGVAQLKQALPNCQIFGPYPPR